MMIILMKMLNIVMMIMGTITVKSGIMGFLITDMMVGIGKQDWGDEKIIIDI